jgi:hypothetical protein
MPRVFRQQYTRPIPPDAQRVTHKGKPAVRFRGADGKVTVAPLTQRGDRCRVPSPLWYGQYRDSDGAVQRVPLCENKVAAEQMLKELVQPRDEQGERRRSAGGDRNRPLPSTWPTWRANCAPRPAASGSVPRRAPARRHPHPPSAGRLRLPPARLHPTVSPARTPWEARGRTQAPRGRRGTLSQADAVEGIWCGLRPCWCAGG